MKEKRKDGNSPSLGLHLECGQGRHACCVVVLGHGELNKTGMKDGGETQRRFIKLFAGPSEFSLSECSDFSMTNPSEVVGSHDLLY